MTGSSFLDPRTKQDIPLTAKVIRFPVPGEARPKERFAHALEALHTALERQKTALATWRGALIALQASTSQLDDSLQQYTTCLEALGEQDEGLNDRAITMEQWADSLLTK